MALSRPSACHPPAFEFFRAQIPQLDSNQGLLRAAVAVSMHQMRDLSPVHVERQLSRLGGRVRRRVSTNQRSALLAHLHHELFEKSGFRGNADEYYDPRNSYVPCVLDTGLGIPISLSLIYTLVARRIGLRADGINAPGHFLVQVSGELRPMFVDPFYQGQVLSREEAFCRMDQALGRRVPRELMHLRTATHVQWIERLIHNLVNIFTLEGREADMVAMLELLALLDRHRGGE